MTGFPPAYETVRTMVRGRSWGTLVILVCVSGGLVAAFLAARPDRPRVTGTTGGAVYAQTCATCHGMDGNGVNRAFPPLEGSPWVNLPERYLARLVLRGLRGPIVVHDQTYNNVMPPHDFLTDEQMAAVLTFVRTEFGAGGVVTPAQIAAERADFGPGAMWTIESLLGSSASQGQTPHRP